MKVVIVGAGPAGLISALNLIQEGIRPVILERKSAIRPSACAEACDLQLLKRIPFNSDPYICKQVKGARLIYTDGTCSYVNKISVVLERINWQEGMAREIETRGGQIRLNCEVTAIGEDSVQLKNGDRIDYEVLIGADGPNSRIAKHMGIKHQSVVVSQYKLAFDTSHMDYLEFYIDRRFSPVYSWIFPKDGIINVGIEGGFTRLDAFLKLRGLDGNKIIAREAGIMPFSGIHKLIQHNIALIGDSASMPNPLSGGGLTPIIYAGQMLAKNINNLKNYEREVKRHPIASPVLAKARRALLELADKDLTNLLSLLTEPYGRKTIYPSIGRTVKYLSLIPKFKTLTSAYRALKITRTHG
ncbi:NAD(P)/FAD-dependent oxidoreductase [Chloroflexota bacterium]